MSQFMEENLDLSVRDLLQIMQTRMVTQSAYFGIQTMKSPTDFWVYQELIYARRPDVIIEIGNLNGGSTLALAHLCDAMNHGRIIAIDITHHRIGDQVRDHPRITLIEGDACEKYPHVANLIEADERVFIIEDSAHTYDNTLNVLRTYSGLLRFDDYFVVEDSICHHGVDTGPKPGPYEAIETFIGENTRFEIDRSQEAYFITWNPKGYLRCVDSAQQLAPHAQPAETSRIGRIRDTVRKGVLLITPPILVKTQAMVMRNIRKRRNRS